jgi:hypothetical protein
VDWKRFLQDNLSPMLARWNEFALEIYPAETVRFMRRQKDRFQNPVGYATATAQEEILRGLAEGKRPAQLGEPLDRLARVRAVQDFSPSAALRFLPALRRVLRAEAGSTLPDGIDEFDAIVDELALDAFDRYMRCREQVYELRAEEYKRRTASLLRRAERSSTGSEKSDESTVANESSKGGCGA